MSEQVADRPTVLFVCVHNAGRSQTAAGCLEHLTAGPIDVLSAGSEPAADLNPVATRVRALIDQLVPGSPGSPA